MIDVCVLVAGVVRQQAASVRDVDGLEADLLLG
jgi:hypothetical protein